MDRPVPAISRQGCLFTALGAQRTSSRGPARATSLSPPRGLSRLPSKNSFSAGRRESAPMPLRIMVSFRLRFFAG